jgi:hypothetical protein
MKICAEEGCQSEIPTRKTYCPNCSAIRTRKNKYAYMKKYRVKKIVQSYDENPDSISWIDRSTPTGFMKYMLKNPFYFMSLSHKPFSIENIKETYEEFKEEGIILST